MRLKLLMNNEQLAGTGWIRLLSVEEFHLRKKKVEHLKMLDPEGKLSATQLELYEAGMKFLKCSPFVLEFCLHQVSTVWPVVVFVALGMILCDTGIWFANSNS